MDLAKQLEAGTWPGDCPSCVEILTAAKLSEENFSSFLEFVRKEAAIHLSSVQGGQKKRGDALKELKAPTTKEEVKKEGGSLPFPAIL